jgi:hypothetical protein
VDREDVPNLLAAFDVPSPDASQSIRTRTTVPQQALFMINSKFVIDQAKILANSTASTTDTRQRIINLYRRTLVRDPNDAEIELAMQFLNPAKTELSGTESTPEQTHVSKQTLDLWIQFAQVLMASNEFAFVD